MQYLHSMIRVTNLEATLDFFCNKLGMVETRRYDNSDARFSLIFLAADEDVARADQEKSPLLELTYNWPDENGNVEDYGTARNFGHLAYRVDNIYDTCQKLMDGGIVINRPPRDGYMAFVKSPDGISLELLQKGDSLPPQEPWVSMQNIGSW